jgi:hydroxyacylglutathione hydrolase
MEIKIIPVLSDNYIFVLCDRAKKIAAVVDPAIAPPVLEYLEELDVELIAIFNTHHHSDHVGGNKQLMQRFPNVCVYGGAADRGRIPGQRVFLEEGDTVTFGDRTAQIFFVPGHTRAHIAYYFPPSTSEESGELFCGDTLFAGGCGRLFEGTPSQMVTSLDKLRNLPDNTRVWCAHEYTLKNLQFALTVDGDNSQLQTRYQGVKTARSQGIFTIPSILGLEKQTNPFLRWDTPQLQAKTKMTEPARVFGRIRGMKDTF